MFCPKCRAEYREGFTNCAYCNVDLVNELDSQPEPEFVDLEEVITTNDIALVAFIKSILEAEKIPYHIQGEKFAAIQGRIPIRFLVPKDYLEKAKEILVDLI